MNTGSERGLSLDTRDNMTTVTDRKNRYLGQIN